MYCKIRMPDLVQPSHFTDDSCISCLLVQCYCCYTVSKCKCSQIKALENPLMYKRCSHSVVVYISTFLAFKPITGYIHFSTSTSYSHFFHNGLRSLSAILPCQFVCVYICKRRWFNPCVGKIPWKRTWQPPPIFLPGESHGLGSLAGYSP